MKKILSLAMVLLSMNAFADQCAYITNEQAQSAVGLIALSQENSGDVLSLCQNCGESIPEVLKIKKVSVRGTGVSDVPAEVTINGKGIDLAYTYVNIGNGMYVNLGKLSNCANEGASQFIIKGARTNGKIQFFPSPIF